MLYMSSLKLPAAKNNLEGDALLTANVIHIYQTAFAESKTSKAMQRRRLHYLVKSTIPDRSCRLRQVSKQLFAKYM